MSCSSLSSCGSSFSTCVTWMRLETWTDAVGDCKLMLMVPISWWNSLVYFFCWLLGLLLFSVVYLFSSVCLKVVILLWFLASCLILSPPRIFENFLVLNWEVTLKVRESLWAWCSAPGCAKSCCLCLLYNSTRQKRRFEEMFKSVASFQTYFLSSCIQ